MTTQASKSVVVTDGGLGESGGGNSITSNTAGDADKEAASASTTTTTSLSALHDNKTTEKTVTVAEGDDGTKKVESVTATPYHYEEVGDIRFWLLGRYSNLRLLGVGAQGIVVSAWDSVRKSRVAIKKLHRPFKTLTLSKQAYREFKLLRIIDHKNIIALHHAFTPQISAATMQDVYLVMELMDGDLGKAIRTELDHDRISFLFYQLLCGVKHLHDLGIVHRDLKPGNIVVNEQCLLKILDFGLARTSADGFQMSPYVVTRYYRAPEVILGLSYGAHVDIWSGGCILAEMFWHRILFPGSDYIDQWNQITTEIGTPEPAFLEKLPINVRNYVVSTGTSPARSFKEVMPDEIFPEPSKAHKCLNAENARDLLSKMLVFDPEKRITVDEALNHPYITIWFQENDISTPKPLDLAFDDMDYTIEEWREMLFNEIQIMDAEMKNL